MRKVRYSVAMSLDGYILGPDGDIDWIVNDPEIDFAEYMKNFDTLLIGRLTWEFMHSMEGGTGAMEGMTSYLFSTTMKQEDIKGATLSSDAIKTVTELKAAEGKDMWLFGGGVLAASLMKAGLVDMVEVGVMPAVIGGGLPLLPDPEARKMLKLVSHDVLGKSGIVGLKYDVV